MIQMHLATSEIRAARQLEDSWPRPVGQSLLRTSVTWVSAAVALFASAWSGEPTALPTPSRPNSYLTILWTGESPYRQPDKIPMYFERLKEMGVNTAMVHGGDADPAPPLQNGFRYYVENIVNRGLCLKWNSPVTDWEAMVTRWATNRDEASLHRPYSFDDPQWLNLAKAQMTNAARKHGPHHPVLYNIRDELSVTTSANPFDYDFSPSALEGFRSWLKGTYGTLAALNAQWDTSFPSWEAVRPFTTDQIKARVASGEKVPRGKPDWHALQKKRLSTAPNSNDLTAWNLSPWADFRTYMDLSLARTLAECRSAARTVDPHTPVGIEGTQMPHAFGGSDLWRLSQALDWVEPYDIGNAREIFGSFMPQGTLLTTVFESETNPASRRLWHLLLQGDRGCILWWSEDCMDWKSPAYDLTPKAKALAPVLKEMTGPLAALFLNAQRVEDPIRIHYSQSSIQVGWMMDSCADGSTWLRRFSSFEAEHSRMVKIRDSWLKALQDLGYSPRFVSSEQLEQADSLGGVQALVLAGSIALSQREAERIRAFVSSQTPGRVVFADGCPGRFDGHGRLRPASPLQDWIPNAESEARSCAVGSGTPVMIRARAGDVAEYTRERLKSTPDPGWTDWIAQQLSGVPREVFLPSSARVRVHRFQLGSARLIALERNILYQMSEDLKQAGGNQALESSITVPLEFAEAGFVYDLRSGTLLAEGKTVSVTIDPWKPTLLAKVKTRMSLASLREHLEQAASQRNERTGLPNSR
jgi:hypothetical protein